MSNATNVDTRGETRTLATLIVVIESVEEDGRVPMKASPRRVVGVQYESG